MKKILLPITLFFCFLSVKAEIKLPNIIGSNMVIQQNADVRFWGKAAKNAKVEFQSLGTRKSLAHRQIRTGIFLLPLRQKILLLSRRQ